MITRPTRPSGLPDEVAAMPKTSASGQEKRPLAHDWIGFFVVAADG